MCEDDNWKHKFGVKPSVFHYIILLTSDVSIHIVRRSFLFDLFVICVFWFTEILRTLRTAEFVTI